jgi:CheY-like chemotaxis protein
MAATILMVEDESRLAEILGDYLRREGFRTEWAKDGGRALELWRAARPDLILLDVMLPIMDGLEVARRVRAESSVPIIMLTARDEEVDKLLGLGLGADDYVVKPYSPREVVARVKAVLRRAGGGVLTPAVFRVGGLELDLGRYEARCDGEGVALTAGELRFGKRPARLGVTVAGDLGGRAAELMVVKVGELAGALEPNVLHLGKSSLAVTSPIAAVFHGPVGETFLLLGTVQPR